MNRVQKTYGQMRFGSSEPGSMLIHAESGSGARAGQTQTPVSQMRPPLQNCVGQVPPPVRQLMSLSMQPPLRQQPLAQVVALHGRHAPPEQPLTQ
jgi:hypothetical protein